MLLIATGASLYAHGQNVGLKTNLLYDVGLMPIQDLMVAIMPNFGVDVGVAPKWTIGVSASLCVWDQQDESLRKLWVVQPEVRYWFRNRFGGHFVGTHIMRGEYNFIGFDGKLKFPGWDKDLNYVGTDFSAFKNNRYQGWFEGAGLTYGYNLILGGHWNLEAEIGVGYVYSEYDLFECKECGRRIKENAPHHYVGPTKAALNLMFRF